MGDELPEKPIIVGIDPGTTTAIAFLDAYGRPIEVKSSKRYSEEEVIKEIREHGKIMILGTDKSSFPNALKNIATKFKCRVSSPKEDLSKERKSELTEKYRHLLENEHEKDALASAIYAYRDYSKQLKKIRRRNKGRYTEVVRKKILGIKEKEPEKQKKITKKGYKGKEEQKRKIKRLTEKLGDFEKRLENKEGKIKNLKNDISDLKEKRGITEREAYLQSKINKLKRDKNRLKSTLKRFAEAHDSGKIKKMNESQMKSKKYTENPETFEELREKGQEAYLVDILLETDEYLYYTEEKRSEPRGNVVKDIINRYRKKRE